MRLALAILIFALLAPGAHAASVWRSTGDGVFVLDRAALRSAIRAGVVPIPAPDGTTRPMRFRSTQVSTRRLARAARFRAFTGTGVRFDVSPIGFHASVRLPQGRWYVDPLGDDRYVARSTPVATERPGDRVHRRPLAGRAARVPRAGGGAVTRRDYRLALASDSTYSTRVGGTANVLPSKLALVNRIDQIYEDDLAIRLTLVANITTYPTASTCSDAVLDGLTSFIDGALAPNGSSKYDIGHLVIGADGGGVAELGSVGQNSVKGAGCTGLPNPVGDAFAVDYVAHEMGHQFGANHTFNGTQQTCGSQRNNATAVEPGSGSSVMAYAGICGADDLQEHSDPYFSQASIAEIAAYVARSIPGASNGGTPAPTGDRAPIVFAPFTHTIPLRTPFSLIGGATDADGDPLTYLWEQNDRGSGTDLKDTAKVTGPLFRQFGAASVQANPFAYATDGENVAGASDYLRTFPDPRQISSGATDALTGACAGVDCLSEFLPNTPRELNFRLTARDGRGGVAAADAKLIATGAEPFRVTAPNSGMTTGGARVEVTWDPVGTACAPYDTTAVRISFSSDGGMTFPYAVVSGTANDGAETATVPNVATTKGRFKVEAIGNVFFDVTHGDLVVGAGPGSVPAPSAASAPLTAQPVAQPAPAYYDLPCGPAPPTVTPAPDPVVASAPSGPGAVPTTSPAPVAGVSLRPSLAGTRRRLAVSRHRKVKVRLRCVVVGDGRPPTRCRGRIGLSSGPRRSFSVLAAKRTSVTLLVSRRTYRRLRRDRRKATLQATVGSAKASKRVVLHR